MNQRMISPLCAALVLFWCSSSTAFVNPSYVTTQPHPASGELDTIAIIEFLSEPALFTPSDLQISWITPFEIEDSLNISAAFGQICAFDYDRLSHTWHGTAKPGDTLTCTFRLVPLTIGPLAIAFRVNDPRSRFMTLWASFTLDEGGSLVREPENKLYGTLGLAPAFLRDTINIIDYPCYEEEWTDRASESLHMKAIVSPPPGPSDWSDVTVIAQSNTDLELGAYYSIGTDDVIQVELPEDSDWPHLVRAGEELRIRFKMRPARGGLGSILVQVNGYRPPHEPPRRGSNSRGGCINGMFQMAFAFDRNLNMLAYSLGNIRPEPQPGSTAEGRNDAYRMPAIEAVRTEPVGSVTVYSASHETREKELSEQIRLRRQLEKTEGR